MTATLPQPLRWQLGTTSLLAVTCALAAGAWLVSASGNRHPSFQTKLTRTFPQSSSGENPAEALQQQKEDALKEQGRLEAQLKQRERERNQIQAKVTKIESSMKAAAGTSSPEQQEIIKLRQKNPNWKDLSLPQTELDTIILVWESKSTDVNKAVEHLSNSRKAWQDKAANESKASTSDRAARELAVTDMIKRFEKDSGEVVAVLRLDELSTEATDQVLAAVKKLFMSGGNRAEPRENFTNSVGMELVWVADGGFWIGKTEVTSAARNTLMNTGGGSNSPAEGINFIQAVTLCEKLTQRESQNGDPNARMMPLGAGYTLPGVKQWRMARDQAEALGLSGFSNDLSEWSADKHSSGLANRSLNFMPAQASWFLALKGDEAVALPSDTTGSIRTTGKDTKAVKGGTVDHWQGRIGFRVILLPPQAR